PTHPPRHAWRVASHACRPAPPAGPPPPPCAASRICCSPGPERYAATPPHPPSPPSVPTHENSCTPTPSPAVSERNPPWDVLPACKQRSCSSAPTTTPVPPFTWPNTDFPRPPPRSRGPRCLIRNTVPPG